MDNIHFNKLKRKLEQFEASDFGYKPKQHWLKETMRYMMRGYSSLNYLPVLKDECLFDYYICLCIIVHLSPSMRELDWRLHNHWYINMSSFKYTNTFWLHFENRKWQYKIYAKSKTRDNNGAPVQYIGVFLDLCQDCGKKKTFALMRFKSRKAEQILFSAKVYKQLIGLLRNKFQLPRPRLLTI